MAASCKEAWRELYVEEQNRLKRLEGDYCISEALRSPQAHRYPNILPFDRTRVRLRDSKVILNANHVDTGKRMIVACQAPLEHQIYSFWRMLQESGTRVIVTLTSANEDTCPYKINKYWPDSVKQSLISRDLYGSSKVVLMSLADKDGIWTERELLVQLSGRSGEAEPPFTVMQLHFRKWPDFGVPEDTKHLTKFLARFWELQGNAELSSGPPVVHCSAGVGRTGTFAAIDSAGLWLKENANRLQDKEKAAAYVKETVRSLRKQRAHMVQRYEQYEFVHVMVDALAQSHS